MLWKKMEPDDITEIQKTTQLAETTGSQNDLGKNQCELLRAGGTECITGERAREDNRVHTWKGLRLN